MKALKNRLQYNLGLIRQIFARSSSSFSGMCFKCERNSQTCSSIHHCGVWPQPDPGNHLRNLNVNKDSVSSAGRDCGIEAPHQLNGKQQFGGSNCAWLLHTATLNGWLPAMPLLRGSRLLSLQFFFEVGRQLALMLKQFRPSLWFGRQKLFITGRFFGAIRTLQIFNHAKNNEKVISTHHKIPYKPE